MAATCRAAVPGDFDAVAQIWHESARSADGASTVLLSVQELRARLDREIAAGWDLTVALQNERIVGFLALKPTIAVLDQIFVLPDCQRLGIGQILLDRAKHAMLAGFTLRTASANARARRFYSRAGLALIEEGLHPQSGYPVSYYGWNSE